MKLPLSALAFVFLSSPASAGEAAKKPAPPAKNPVVLIKTNEGDIRVELFPDEAPKTVENFLGLAEGRKEWTDPTTSQKVKKPYFDGLPFHRVIDGFMLQGGCPLGTGFGGPGYSFADEINARALGLNKLKVLGPGGQPHEWLLIRSQEDYRNNILMPLYRIMGIRSQEDVTARKEEIEAKLASLTLQEAYENMGYRYDAALKSRAPVTGSLAMANSGPNTNGSQFFINIEDTPHLTGKHTVFGRVVSGMDVVKKIGAKYGRGATAEKAKILSVRQAKP